MFTTLMTRFTTILVKITINLLICYILHVSSKWIIHKFKDIVQYSTFHDSRNIVVKILPKLHHRSDSSHLLYSVLNIITEFA